MPDIKEINGKYYDFAPRNESFLITAKELKSVGIKNYYFMLRIDNPRVAMIDPFNPKITRQEMQLLIQEYKHNMWMFIRDAVRLRTDKGVVPYELHRGLAAAAWCFERNQDCCLCEPRQTYKTTGIIAGPLQWAYQLSSNLIMHFFGKETENTKRNLASLKADIELLPEWLRFTRWMSNGKEEKAHMSTEYFRNDHPNIKNTIYIHSKPTSVSSASNMGRGASGAILMFDELAHTLNLPPLWGNSYPLFKTAHDNAVSVGKPSARICTCTPPDLDTKEGRESNPILKSMIPWTEKIYDMTDQEIEEYKDTFRDEYHRMAEFPDREVVDVFYIEYQYFQVRKTYEWVMEQFRGSGDRQAVRREILLQTVRGSANSFLDQDEIEFLVSNMKKSTDELLLCRKWVFKLYEHGAKSKFGENTPFDKNIPYIVGIDPAGGTSGHRGDYFAITIVNPNNLKIAAEFHSQYIGGPNAFKMLQELILDYIPRAVLVIERNSMGTYLIQWLLTSQIRDNLYWSNKGAEKEIDALTYESAADKELRKLSEENGKYGTYLTASVRSAMFELLKMLVQECRENLCTEYLVNDLCKLVNTNGKPQADKGEHDDSLMSFLHAIYIYYTGDNLRLFGIERKAYPTYKDEDIQESPDRMFTMNEMFARMGVTPKDEIPTYDELYKRSVSQINRSTQEMIDRLPNTYAFGYQKSRPDNPIGTEMVDIPSSFFDELNGIDFF